MAKTYDRKSNNTTNYTHPNEQNLWELHKSMAYNPYGRPVVTVDDDTVQHTSKNRRKVSHQEILYFNTFQYDKDLVTWDEVTTGSGTATFDPYIGNVVLEVGSDQGAEVIRQTRTTVRYTPGRQNEISFAVRGESPDPGIRRRIGLFDELNGVYFENDGEDFVAVVRRNTSAGVVEERATRSEWNVDKMDGLGPSGIVGDASKQQLLTIEYEWYGAGMVEFKWVIDNNSYPVHRFYNANRSETTWSSTAILPVRIELTNIGGSPGTHRLYQGSMSVLAEGNTGAIGREFNVASPIAGKLLATALTFYPVLSVRLRGNRLRAVAVLTEFQAATLDNSNIFFRLYRNAALTGATWNPAASTSFLEYDTSATALTNGTIFKTGFINTGAQGLPIQFFAESTVNQLSRINMGTEGEIITIAIAAQGANRSVMASLSWLEIK